MITKSRIEKIAEGIEPFELFGEKDMIVFLCEKIAAVHDERTLNDAFHGVLKCARTLGMDFEGLKNTEYTVSKATNRETLYPLLKVLFTTYSIRKKIIIATGYLAEYADEKKLRLC